MICRLCLGQQITVLFAQKGSEDMETIHQKIKTVYHLVEKRKTSIFGRFARDSEGHCNLPQKPGNCLCLGQHSTGWRGGSTVYAICYNAWLTYLNSHVNYLCGNYLIKTNIYIVSVEWH